MSYINSCPVLYNSATVTTIAFPALNVIAGGFLKAFFAYNTLTGDNVDHIDDPDGGLWLPVDTPYTSGATECEWWYCASAVANVAKVVTAHFSSGVIDSSALLVQHDDVLDLTHPIDTFAYNSGSGTAVVSGAFSTGAANTLAMLGITGLATMTAGAGMVMHESVNYASAEGGTFTSLQTGATISATNGGSSAWLANLAVFRLVAAGGNVSTPQLGVSKGFGFAPATVQTGAQSAIAQLGFDRGTGFALATTQTSGGGGTITLPVLKSNNAVVQPSVTGILLYVYSAAGVHVVDKTVASDGSGIVSFSDALIVTGTRYLGWYFDPVTLRRGTFNQVATT